MPATLFPQEKANGQRHRLIRWVRKPIKGGNVLQPDKIQFSYTNTPKARVQRACFRSDLNGPI